MSRYEVQFKSSSIVAFKATDRGICQYWLECNDYGPEMPYCDPVTGDEVPGKYVRGSCLNLFKLVKMN